MSISFAATPQSKEAQQARTYTDPSRGAPPSRRSGANAPYIDKDHWNKVFTEPEYFDSIAKQKGMAEGAKVSLFGDDYVYRQAMIGYMSDTRNVPLDDMRKVFDVEKDAFAQKNLGKKTATAREMFDWQKSKFERENEKQAAARQILNNVAQRAMTDFATGGDTPFVETVAKDIDAAGDMFTDEEKSRLWQMAEENDIKLRATQMRFAPEAKFIFDALRQTTGEGAGFGAPDMREMATRFAKLPDNQRKAIYELAGSFAQLNQTDKGFWYQMAESLGRGASDIVERVPRNIKEQALRNDLRLLEGKQPVFAGTGVQGTAYSAFGTTPLTPEERQQAAEKVRGELGIFKVERELRDLAERVIDPIKTVTVLPEIVEEGLYGAARSIPYTATAAVPYIGTPAVAGALYSSNYDRIMLEYPDIDPDKAALIAAISAPIEAGLERMKVNTIMGRLPFFGGLVKRFQHPNQRNITRIAIGGAGVLAEQNAQEILQNATFPFVQMIGSVLDKDIPEYNLDLASMPRDLAVQFVALLPLSLMGIGALSHREISRGEAYLRNKDNLEKAGYSEEQIDRITGAATADEAQSILREESKKRDPEKVKAAAQRIVDESIALREKANPAALPRLEKQGADYVVLSPEGKELARERDQTAAEQALVSARRETVQREMRDVHTGINEAVEFIKKVNEARQRGEDIAKVIREQAPRTLLTDYEANPTQENLDRLFETVRAFGQEINEPAELANFPVTGSNQGALREGIWRSIIRINEGADGTIVMREFAQDNLKRAIAEGRVTMDFVRQQLNDILPQIDSDRMERRLRTETDTDVIEAFSDIAVAYFRGSIREEQIPAGLRGIMRRLAIMTRDIFRRAYNLARLRAEGKLDRDFEALLAEAVGVNQQALVDRARERTEQEVGAEPAVANYSIASLGDSFPQFSGKPQEAIDYLLTVKRGYVPAAWSHPQIGEVDLIYGTYTGKAAGSAGLAKIAGKRPEMVATLGEDFQNATVDSDNENTIQLSNGDKKFIVRKTYFDNQMRWLLTAYKQDGEPASETIDTADPDVSAERRDDRLSPQGSQDNLDAQTGEVKEQAASGEYPSTTENYSIGLVSLHKLSEEKLRFADRMGGLAVPSIAVTKVGTAIEGFGEITLVAGQELGDPSLNPVYDADAYTSRFPKPEYKKVKSSVAQKLVNFFRPFDERYASYYGDRVKDIVWDNAVNTPNPDETINKLTRSNVAKAAYLSSVEGVEVEPVMRPKSQRWGLTGTRAMQAYIADAPDIVSIDYDDVAARKKLTDAVLAAMEEQIADKSPEVQQIMRDGMAANIEEDTGLLMFGRMSIVREDIQKYGQMEVDAEATAAALDGALAGREEAFVSWVESTIRDMYAPPRIKVAGKWQPYTLENIARVMTAGRIAGVEKVMAFGEGPARAAAARRFGSLNELRNAAEGLATEEEAKSARATAKEFISQWREQVIQFYKWDSTWDALDNAMQALARFYKAGDMTERGMQRALRSLDFVDVPSEVAAQGIDAARALMNTPVPYFESKPQRVVRLNEFKAAIVPKSVSVEAVNILTGHGLEVVGVEMSSDAASPELQAALESVSQDISYSISTQSEIDRVQAAMGRLSRSPSERIAQYAALKERLASALERNQPIMQSMRGDTLPQDFDRTRLLNDLGFLDYILKVLPPEVRGRVGGYTNLAAIAPVDVYKGDQKVSEAKNPAGAIISAWMREGLNIGQAQKKTELPEGYSTVANTSDERRDKTIANFLIDRLKKIDRELERYYKRDIMERIFDVLDKSRPKAGDSGVKRSTLGPETQKFADMVYRASLLDDEETAKRLAAIEGEITSIEAKDEGNESGDDGQKLLSQLSEEWTIVNTFGDLKSRPSETLAYGLEWLQGQLKAGREAWNIKEAARIQENRERAAKVIAFLGKPTDIGRFKNNSALQRFLQATNAFDLDHKSFEQFAFWLFGDEVSAELSEKMQRAQINEAKAELDNTQMILAAMRQGAKSAGMTTGKALVAFKSNQSNAVRKLEGRKVKDTKISIDLAKKIVRGLADRGSLSQADVQTLADELAALPRDTKKEFVTIKQVIFRGEEVRLTMSRAQAMQLWLTWQQTDAQEKMRRDGFTDDSFEDLDNLISDPFSQAILRVTQRIYGSGYALTNPIYARMFGMNMPMVRNYAPARYLSSKQVKDISLDGTALTAGGQPSFAKSRVNHTAKLAPEDALIVLQSHLAQQSHWVAFAEVTREYRSLLSTPDVREAIRQRFGEDVLRTADMWGDQMEQRGGNKGREIAVINNALGAIIGGQSVSLLGFNLKSLSMQTDNLLRFFWALNSRQIASAFSDPAGLMKAIRKVWKTDILQTRLKGGATAETRFLFNRFVSMFRRGAKMSELAMLPMNYADSAGLSISGAIVYQAAYKDAVDSGMDETSADKAAKDAVEAMIFRYGQPVLMGQKSNVENSGGVFAKTFSIFMSDPRLKTAILTDAIRGLSTGRGDWKDHVRRIIGVELMALVAHVLATGFRDLTSDDEDEDLWSMGGFARALLLAPFQGYFFLGSVSDLVLSRLTEAKWFMPTQDPFIRTANTAVRAVNNLDDAFNFDDPDALVKEWTDITRSIALTPPLAAPAVIMNLVRPLVQGWERIDDDE